MAYRGPTTVDHQISTRESNMASGSQGQKPLSRLQQLQIDYQAKLLREKEEKLARMYQDSQKRAMERVTQNSGKGMVRDFFKERRNFVSQQTPVPDIHQHYKTKKKYEYSGPSSFQQSKPPVPPGHQPQQKNSAGRDRAHPLAPIERTKTYDSGSLSDGGVINSPKPLKKQRSGHSNNMNTRNNSHYGSEGSLTSPVNNDERQNMLSGSSKARVAKYKQRKAQVFKQDVESSDEEPVKKSPNLKQKQKMTEFQKWQKEQDAARQKRLEDHQKQHAGKNDYDGTFNRGEDEEDEEEGKRNDEDRIQVTRAEQEQKRQQQLIKQKEQELMRLLAKQKEELKKMQQEREREEEEEKKFAKREAAEKERKRRLQVAAEEQKKREEEQNDWEEEQKLKEEENDRVSARNNHNTAHHNGSTPTNLVQEKPVTPKDVFHKKAIRVKPHPPNRPPTQPTRSQPKPKPEPEPEPESSDPKTPPSTFYEEAALNAVTSDDVDIEFAQCSICGRKFASDRLDKHMKVCAKNTNKKRKVFDPSIMRTRGTEQEKYVKEGAKKPEPPKKASNWRAKHEEFIKNLQYAKKVKAVEDAGGNLADLPPPPPTENPDYVQCPNCQRKFNQTAAERHIPRCKELKTKPAKRR